MRNKHPELRIHRVVNRRVIYANAKNQAKNRPLIALSFTFGYANIAT